MSVRTENGRGERRRKTMKWFYFYFSHSCCYLSVSHRRFCWKHLVLVNSLFIFFVVLCSVSVFICRAVKNPFANFPSKKWKISWTEYTVSVNNKPSVYVSGRYHSSLSTSRDSFFGFVLSVLSHCNFLLLCFSFILLFTWAILFLSQSHSLVTSLSCLVSGI